MLISKTAIFTWDPTVVPDIVPEFILSSTRNTLPVKQIKL